MLLILFTSPISLKNRDLDYSSLINIFYNQWQYNFGYGILALPV